VFEKPESLAPRFAANRSVPRYAGKRSPSAIRNVLIQKENAESASSTVLIDRQNTVWDAKTGVGSPKMPGNYRSTF
jgi:hypothetical protein